VVPEAVTSVRETTVDQPAPGSVAVGAPGSVAEGPTSEVMQDGIVLEHLPETRRQILTVLKKRGEVGADELATVLGITVSAVRQHLGPLEEDGLVRHRQQPSGPGRPRHRFELTTAAEVLFPKRYGELTNQLLGFIADADAGLVDLAFDRRRQARLDRARIRLDGLDFPGRVRELAKILDEDGYLADCQRQDDGSWRIVEHNCAIIDVARRYGNACVSEIAFLRQALPEADIERVAHMIAGAHVCAYQVRLRG
jgi:DeoR family suf operon transcriptional repressor